MSSTITLTGDWLTNTGNRMQTTGVGNLGVYATGGVAVSATKVGLSTIISMSIDPAGGYFYTYIPSTGKVKAFYGSGGGGVAAHTHDLKIIGGQAAASTAATAYYATDIFGKEAATSKTIAGADSATKGGVVEVGAASGGTPGVEVTDTTDITTAAFTFTAIGY